MKNLRLVFIYILLFSHSFLVLYFGPKYAFTKKFRFSRRPRLHKSSLWKPKTSLNNTICLLVFKTGLLGFKFHLENDKMSWKTNINLSVHLTLQVFWFLRLVLKTERLDKLFTIQCIWISLIYCYLDEKLFINYISILNLQAFFAIIRGRG